MIAASAALSAAVAAPVLRPQRPRLQKRGGTLPTTPQHGHGRGTTGAAAPVAPAAAPAQPAAARN